MHLFVGISFGEYIKLDAGSAQEKVACGSASKESSVNLQLALAEGRRAMQACERETFSWTSVPATFKYETACGCP